MVKQISRTAQALVLVAFVLATAYPATARADSECLTYGKRAYAQAAKLWAKTALAPARAIVERDASYETENGERLAVRIYEPKVRSAKPRKLVIQIHGGGWVVGSPRDIPDIARTLAGEGVVVLAPAYRLVPHAYYPAPITDLRRFAAWVSEQSEALHVQTQGVGVWGFSAGAYQAHQFVIDALAPGFPLEVTRALVFAGRSDLTADPNQGPALVRQFLRSSLAENPKLWREASPLSRIPELWDPKTRLRLEFWHQSSDQVIPLSQSCLSWRAWKGRAPGPQVGLTVIPTTGLAHGPTGTSRRAFMGALKGLFLRP